MSEFENATPRPWDKYPVPLSPYVEIRGKQGPITVCPAIAHSKGDAELIVRAVNAFEPMVDALEDARKAISNAIEVVGSRKGDPEFATLAKVEAALAKARGEQ